MSLFPAVLAGVSLLGLVGGEGLVTDASDYVLDHGADKGTADALEATLEHIINASSGALGVAFVVSVGLAINGGTLMQPATARLLQTPQRLTSGQETNYGLGWELHNVTLAGGPTQAPGHGGELLGRRVASLRMFHEGGIVVALMSNTPYADISTLALRVAEAFAQPARGGTNR